MIFESSELESDKSDEFSLEDIVLEVECVVGVIFKKFPQAIYKLNIFACDTKLDM